MKYLKDLLLVLIIFGMIYVSVTVLFSGLAPKAFKKDFSNADPHKYGSIIRLVLDGRTVCSGTVIQPNLIVTAAHCVTIETPFGVVMNPESPEVRPSENIDLGVKTMVVEASIQMDTALLTGDFSQFNTRKYLEDPKALIDLQRAGKDFISCGYPLLGNLFCTIETFKKRHDFFWEVDGLLLPGMSSGPIMSGGVVVGVNVAVEGPNSIVSPIYNVTALLHKE